MPETIRVAHSPDSDDAFMFYGLASGAVKAEGKQETAVHGRQFAALRAV